MFRNFALYAEADDGDGAGGGAPGGGSPEGGSGKPGDGDKQIPESRLKAALANQAQQLKAEFEARLAEATKPKAEAPQRYSKAQLSAAVERGDISQEQADQTWEAQLRAEVRTEAREEALETVSQAERKRLVDSEVNRYSTVAPEILEAGHATRTEIQNAYNGLLALGQKPSAATQLAAIRQVLGPIDKLERARSGRFQRESHQETGGAGGESGGQRKAGNGKLADQLSASAREHYETGIKRGRYKDWAEVEAELKYASPGAKARLGIS